MTSFSASLDDSGTHDGSLLAVVGGIVFSKQQAITMQEAWNDVLTQYGIRISHASDCNAGHGEFLGWSLDKRHSFCLQLARIISSCASFVMAQGVKPEDYYAVWEELKLKEMDPKMDVYRILLQLCWHRMGTWAQELPVDDTLEIHVEAGNKKASFVNDLYQKVNTDQRARKILRIEKISFTGKSYIPLQAADLLAYKVYRYHPNWDTDNMEEALRELTKDSNKVEIKLYDVDDLRNALIINQAFDKNFIKRKSRGTS